MSQHAAIREEKLKNRIATLYFGKFDCTRIVGNIDFCVLPKRRDPRQMTFIPDAPILWAEAKNHQTDVYRMLAQLILTIGRAASPRPPSAVSSKPPGRTVCGRTGRASLPGICPPRLQNSQWRKQCLVKTSQASKFC